MKQFIYDSLYGIVKPKNNQTIKNINIVIPKILKNILFKIGNMEMRISTSNVTNIIFSNANQWYVDDFTTRYTKLIAKFKEQIKSKVLNPENYKGVDEIILAGGHKDNACLQKLRKQDNIILWNILLDKLENFYYNNNKNLVGRSLGLPDVFLKLKLNEGYFMSLDCLTQIDALSGLIQGMMCDSRNFSGKTIKLGVTIGKIQPELKITYPLIMIRESVTGLYKKYIPISHYDKDNNIVFDKVNVR